MLSSLESHYGNSDGVYLIAFFLSYGGLLFDLFVPIALFHPEFRYPAFMASLFFHLTNACIFTIGIFPYLMLCTNILFVDPLSVRRVLRTVMDVSVSYPWSSYFARMLDRVFPAVKPKDARKRREIFDEEQSARKSQILMDLEGAVIEENLVNHEVLLDTSSLFAPLGITLFKTKKKKKKKTRGHKLSDRERNQMDSNLHSVKLSHRNIPAASTSDTAALPLLQISRFADVPHSISKSHRYFFSVILRSYH